MNQIGQLFRWSSAALLLLTAAAKLISAAGQAPILDYPDPLLGLANRRVLTVVGMVELGVGLVLVAPWLERVPLRIKHLLVAWLGSQFLIYRLAFYWINPGKMCPCLGTVTDWLHLNPQHVNTALIVVVLYFLGGVLWLEWRGVKWVDGGRWSADRHQTGVRAHG